MADLDHARRAGAPAAETDPIGGIDTAPATLISPADAPPRVCITFHYRISRGSERGDYGTHCRRRRKIAATMASQSQPGPTAATSGGGGGGVPLPIPPEERQQYFDNSIWYTLALWPALTVAVQNSFGGPDSSDKRDWFAGAISTLFEQNPATDRDDLVVFLLQVMQDEFDVMVEDESEEEVAGDILGLRRKVWGEGERGVYEALVQRWRGRGKMKVELREVEEEEGEWSDEDEIEEGGEDVEMGGMEEEAPKEKKEKPLPEIDEDGFEKVVSKKKR